MGSTAHAKGETETSGKARTNETGQVSRFFYGVRYGVFRSS
jgi:hypothetical protein